MVMRALKVGTFLALLGAMPAAESLPGSDLTHAILDAQDHRRADDPALVEGLASAEPRVRALAALALGRIGSAASVTALTTASADGDATVRRNAIFSLGLIGGADALSAVIARFPEETSVEAQRELYMALGRAGAAAEVPALALGLDAAAARVRSGAAQGLGLLMNKSDATLPVAADVVTSLLSLAQERGEEAIPAAFALSRYKGAWSPELKSAARDSFQLARDPLAQGLLARVVAKHRDADAFSVLLTASRSRHLNVRTEALRAIGAQPTTTGVISALIAGLSDRDAQPVVQALQSLAPKGAEAQDAAGAVASLLATSGSVWIKGQALETLAAIDAELGQRYTDEVFAFGGALLKNALRAAGTLGGEENLQTLLPYLAHGDITIATATAEALAKFPADLLAQTARDALLTAAARPDLALTSLIAEIAVAQDWKEFAPSFVDAYAFFTRPDDVEGKVAVLNALGKLGGAEHLPLLERALEDDERAVALAAAQAYEAITGTSVMDRVPAASRVRATTPSLAAIRRSLNARVRFTTTRGVVELAMVAEAPLMAHRFVELARSGFYEGLSFHRVVPVFVVQGGDPRGDGYGGPGFLLRDEVSPLSHGRGFVGMATAGKDTGGSQLFVNHAPNLHLDGNYTIFAKVVRGLDVIDALEQGDRITGATVLE